MHCKNGISEGENSAPVVPRPTGRSGAELGISR